MLISVYARPSAPNISSIVESPLALLSSELPRSVIGMDSNAKNRLWNSPVTDTKGRELEDALLLYNLYLANIPTPELDFTPPSTSFVDVTLGGAMALPRASLTTHTFFLSVPTSQHLPCPPPRGNLLRSSLTLTPLKCQPLQSAPQIFSFPHNGRNLSKPSIGTLRNTS